MEVFAGCAQLSACLRTEGFSVFPIDHKVHPDNKAKIVTLDLTQPKDVRLFFETLTTANIAYIHAAPVCGTSSRARDKPLSPELRRIRSVPLRSEQSPLGLPGLPPTEEARVQAANKLYLVTLCVVYVAHKRGIYVSVENPTNSYFWLVIATFCKWYPVLAAPWWALESVNFQACAHGADKDKWTCWYGTPEVFNSLRAVCTHIHPKDAWKPSIGQDGTPCFPTAAEAAYPYDLCHKVALLVRQVMLALLPPEAFAGSHQVLETRTGRQLGISRLPPLVSEYMLITTCEPS